MKWLKNLICKNEREPNFTIGLGFPEKPIHGDIRYSSNLQHCYQWNKILECWMYHLGD